MLGQFLFRSEKNILRMLGQKKISSFFTSSSQKRPRIEDDNTSNQNNNEKKICVEVHTENKSTPAKQEPPGVSSPMSGAKKLVGKSTNGAAVNMEDNISPLPSTPPQQTPPAATASPTSPTSPPLSPEQKAKMEENKLEAKMKLAAKNTNGVVVNMGPTWFKALEPEFAKPYFQQLCKFVESERKSHTVFPPVNEVFTFTTVCEIRKIKVVILGQDPYHGPRQAHGLCFSVQKGVAPPPSLENMYRELKESIEGFEHPRHGNLTGWAKQGVLLLNACLTVKAHNANSHANKGWEQFTDAVITWLNKNLNGVVFMLWGSYAQKKGARIDKKKHHVLKAVHPSPLSAYRGFFGCKHFSEANRLLKQQGKKPIDWKDLPENGAHIHQ